MRQVQMQQVLSHLSWKLLDDVEMLLFQERKQKVDLRNTYIPATWRERKKIAFSIGEPSVLNTARFYTIPYHQTI